MKVKRALLVDGWSWDSRREKVGGAGKDVGEGFRVRSGLTLLV